MTNDENGNISNNCEIKVALITSITSLIVALILGSSSIISTYKSINNNSKIQKKSLEAQERHLKENFTNSLNLIKAERAKSIFLNKKKLEEIAKKDRDKSIKIMVTTVNTTIKDLDSVLTILETKNHDSLLENMLYITNNLNLESSILILESNTFTPNVEAIRSVPNNIIVNYIYFHKNVNKIVLLSKQLISYMNENMKKFPKNTEINIYLKLYKITEKDFFKLIIVMKKLNINIMINSLRIGIINTILSGYDVLKDIEKICDDKTVLPREKYYKKLRNQLISIEKETKAMEKKLKYKSKPLLNLTVDKLYKLYETNSAEHLEDPRLSRDKRIRERQVQDLATGNDH